MPEFPGSDAYAVAAARRVGVARWEDADADPEPVIIPAPEVRGRPAEKSEVPRGAATVINAARKAGWDVEVSYARGPWLNADGTPAYIVDSIVVRLLLPATGQRAAATWVRKPTGDAEAYTFSSAHWVGELGLLSSTDLKRRIKDTPQDGQALTEIPA